MNSTLKNDQFVEYVINISKEVFDEQQQKYMTKTKVNKLAVLVAENLEKNNIQIEDFYCGYYRHGFYSESINKFLRKTYGKKFHLKNVSPNETRIPHPVAFLIKEIILKYKKFFIIDSNRFYDWIYRVKTPKKYRGFYSAHRTFLRLFDIIKGNLNNLKQIFIRFHRKINGLISFYYESIGHVHDDETLQLFRKFTDLIEYTSIKIRNNENPKFIPILGNLAESYDTLLNLLTPYLDTIHGDKKIIPFAIQEHNKKVSFFKSAFKGQISDYYHAFERDNLFPTMEEMDNELESIALDIPPEDRDINKIYEIICAS